MFRQIAEWCNCRRDDVTQSTLVKSFRRLLPLCATRYPPANRQSYLANLGFLSSRHRWAVCLYVLDVTCVVCGRMAVFFYMGGTRKASLSWASRLRKSWTLSSSNGTSVFLLFLRSDPYDYEAVVYGDDFSAEEGPVDAIKPLEAVLTANFQVTLGNTDREGRICVGHDHARKFVSEGVQKPSSTYCDFTFARTEIGKR